MFALLLILLLLSTFSERYTPYKYNTKKTGVQHPPYTSFRNVGAGTITVTIDHNTKKIYQRKSQLKIDVARVLSNITMHI